MAGTDTSILGGLADPVFDAQSIFKGLMDATARPGTIVDLGARTGAPANLAPAAAAILAALADHDTPVFLQGDPDGEAARWLAFQTGAPIALQPGEAVFAALSLGSPVESWDAFPVGSADYPDRSTTLLLPVTALEGGVGHRLSGPGIDGEARMAPQGLPDDFRAWRRANGALFPRGLDLVLVSGTAILSLPRTTAVREA